MLITTKVILTAYCNINAHIIIIPVIAYSSTENRSEWAQTFSTSETVESYDCRKA